MRKLSYVLFLIAVLTLSALPAAAQTPPTTNPDPLLTMLALVPDSSTVRVQQGFGVSYVDYRAVETARGFKRPAPGTDFDLLSSD